MFSSCSIFFGFSLCRFYRNDGTVTYDSGVQCFDGKVLEKSAGTSVCVCACVCLCAGKDNCYLDFPFSFKRFCAVFRHLLPLSQFSALQVEKTGSLLFCLPKQFVVEEGNFTHTPMCKIFHNFSLFTHTHTPLHSIWKIQNLPSTKLTFIASHMVG